jgi:hypothetical protein
LQLSSECHVIGDTSLANSVYRPRSDIEIALLLPAYGAIVGSMLGVIPEGLDWEEPWQVRTFWQDPTV